jgi:hypothetical protein
MIAGETKQQRQADLKADISQYRYELKYFEYLLSLHKYNPELIKPIIKHYSKEIKLTIKEMAGI